MISGHTCTTKCCW